MFVRAHCYKLKRNTVEKLRILYSGNSTDKITQAIGNGACLLDVRAKSEYNNGHVRGSVNIPLDDLTDQLEKLDRQTPILVYCRSGMRSAQAKCLLEKSGFMQVTNGGNWEHINRIVQSLK